MRHLTVIATASLWATAALAGPTYGPGTSATEIKVGQTIPYSGPASGFGLYGRAWTAYFDMINKKGGINGRKITVLSLDNGYNPSKAVEQTRKLVEEDDVLAEIGTVGTVPNAAVQKYMNNKKVPQVLISAGGSRFNDPKNFPWTVPFYPTFDMEASVYAKHILDTRPDARIGILYQNDDYGRDFLKGFKETLGAKVSLIVGEQSYALTDPTVDSQVLALQSAGATVLMQFTTPKFAAQVIRKAHSIGWSPSQYLASPASSIQGTLVPAGVAASTGVMTAVFHKQVGDPAWDKDKDVVDFLAFMKEWAPAQNAFDAMAISGYLNAQLTAIVLDRCKDDLSRENLLKQATTLKDVSLPMLLPGIRVSNTPGDYRLYHELQLARFDGTGWTPVGGLIRVEPPAGN
ncbi:ABC transporter substrate-binding protein [Chelatococcus reniformis]|uniref:Branched-chain amino acid ABC transporter substrate-binding protein n=1 Tax=Chelatococcus reniformis TaxID=1494448 RepID=A0A916UAJ6_9HYPH|nr:ABC transporter substrate-binding protein [Chelatococcus reniformis]GGC65252.1 branched-chain amino acid ABC transporter substrate-binding protein [Chelatococcus reniformis]